MTKRVWFSRSLIVSLVVFAVACAKNPVTGKNQLMLMGEDWERKVGQQQYAPLRQMQGGDYVVDKGVEAYVRKVGERVAKASGRNLPYEFNVINSSVPNAWALPSGKIAINRGLLTELNNEAELAAVLGHEVVHAAARHGAAQASKGVGLQGAVVLATVIGQREGHGQLAQMGSMIGARLISSRYGRDAELESDLYGMRYMSEAGYDPQGAVDLQKTFLRLSKGRRSDFLSGLFASHPPSIKRVQANIATVATLPKGGELGEARYKQVMARMNKSVPAYEKYSEAQAASKAGNSKRALSLVQQALRIEPNEALFHAAIGEFELDANNPRGAKRHFDRAISLNKELFYLYVKRGDMHQQLRNYTAAKADYQRSIQLLPTADANLGLGKIEQAGNRIEEAKKYYTSASQAKSPAGEEAMDRLLALDLNENPQKYVDLRHGVTRQGTLGIELINKTTRPIGSIQISMQSPGSTSHTQNINGSVAAGKSRIVDTGQRISDSQAQNLSIRLLRAKVISN
jgi:predicted Zn-dependent protease